MGTRYRNIDRETPMLLPCDLRDWVAKDDLVHFILEAVNAVDISGEGNHRGTGSEQYPPRMMLALLIYCYASGLFSSRKIEQLTRDSVSVRYLCANTHPDHDTIARFRATRRELFQRSFTAVLQLARELHLTHLGTVHIDGTKLLANASKRATMDLATVEAQLELADRQLAEALLERSEQADQAEASESFRLPRELADAAQRKARLQAAREALQARAAAKPEAKARVNLTDADSALMPQAKGGYVQGYNAQLAVEASGLIVGHTVCAATNDRAELAATAATIVAEPAEVSHVVVDEGYDNQSQIASVEEALDVTVVCSPQRSTRSPAERRTHARAELVEQRTKRAKMAHSFWGADLLYQRQTTIEPVFGHIKHNLRFRGFHVRGLAKVQTEWTLLTAAYNYRQIWRRLAERN